jgi:hypothetical protein
MTAPLVHVIQTLSPSPTAVQVAAAAVLLVEGVERVEQGHFQECSATPCAPASALQRVCSITRRTRLMRSHGCQRRALVSLTSSSARARATTPR